MSACESSHRMATWRLLVAALLLAAGGCARVVLVTPAPPALPAQRIPLDVGLYLTREFKAYAAEIRDADPWISLDLWRYVNLGAASAQQFERELAGTFRSVQILAEAPSAARPASPGLAAVVEPAIEHFDVILRNMFRPLSASVRYRIKLYGPDGQLWMNSSVEGSATALAGPPRITGMAVENAVANAVQRIIESDEMRALLKGSAFEPQRLKSRRVFSSS
jgi:hypothetical protein